MQSNQKLHYVCSMASDEMNSSIKKPKVARSNHQIPTSTKKKNAIQDQIKDITIEKLQPD